MIAAISFLESVGGNIITGILGILVMLLLVVLMVKSASYKKKEDELKKIKKSLENELKEKDEAKEKIIELSSTIKFADDAIISKDMNGLITNWNDGAVKIYGWSREEVIGKHISILYGSTSQHEIDDLQSSVDNGIKINEFKAKRIRKDGNEISITLTVNPVMNSAGNVVGATSISRDITELVKNEKEIQKNYEELSAVYSQLTAAEEELRTQYDELLMREMELVNSELELRNSEERYRMALEVADNAIVEWYIEENEYFLSEKWQGIFDHLDGDDGERTFREDLYTVIHEEDLDNVKKSYKRYIDSSEEIFESEFRILKDSENYKWIYFKGKLVREDDLGTPIKLIGSLTDISAIVEYKEKITYLANFDYLTGLPNKKSFFQSLQNEIKYSLDNNTKGALIAIDLDEFKLINDTLGHNKGDEVLKRISDILKEVTSSNSEIIVSRTGGDEYLILMSNLDNTNEIVQICRSIEKKLREPLIIDKKEIYTRVSVGVAVFPDNGEDKDTLFKNADTALNESKRRGKNKYTFFDKGFEENIIRRDKIEKGLREAMDKEQLKLVYQPKIDIKNDSVYGFEGLLRWHSEELGWVSPFEFIEVAEERGLIDNIGRWVIKEAARQNEIWKNKGYSYKSISVNISPTQLKDENFVQFVNNEIEKRHTEPLSMEFEITETNVMENFDKNIEILNELKNKGIDISLDDFGTGYSSLSYLKELPISTLKIDKSFIDDIEREESKKSIVAGIIQLAHKINLIVVAEGVENKEQLDILKEFECDVIQGYYFGKPISVKEIEEKFFC